MVRRRQRELGAATVEHVALVLLAAAIAVAAVASARVLADRPGTPPLASELLRKQRCAVRWPGPCWQDPLTDAYGRRVAGAVRALAPAPEALPAPGGSALVGVDYRRCRQPSCAIPLPGPAGTHLTVSNRRTTAFTAIEEGAGGEVGIDYWIYRPTLGWELIERRVSVAEVDALAGTPLPADADPVLVPLETLLGRDEARFPPAEEPPWRGLIESRWGNG
jgi:hypothetical protein